MILNKQNKQIQFTIEDEKWRKIFNFSWHKNKDNKVKHEFDVYRKPAVTNVQIKPHSWLTSSTITSIFKGFLARATKIFSKKHLRTETDYLTGIFWKNGYDRKTLQKIITLKRKQVLPITKMITTLTKNKQLL